MNLKKKTTQNLCTRHNCQTELGSKGALIWAQTHSWSSGEHSSAALEWTYNLVRMGSLVFSKQTNHE